MFSTPPANREKRTDGIRNQSIGGREGGKYFPGNQKVAKLSDITILPFKSSCGRTNRQHHYDYRTNFRYRVHTNFQVQNCMNTLYVRSSAIFKSPLYQGNTTMPRAKTCRTIKGIGALQGRKRERKKEYLLLFSSSSLPSHAWLTSRMEYQMAPNSDQCWKEEERRQKSNQTTACMPRIQGTHPQTVAFTWLLAQSPCAVCLVKHTYTQTGMRRCYNQQVRATKEQEATGNNDDT